MPKPSMWFGNSDFEESNRVKVLLTAVGCPGAPSIINLLKNYFTLYGVDCDERAVGLRMINGEVITPALNEFQYKNDILRVCREQKIDYVLPMSTAELMPLAKMTYDAYDRISALVSQPEVLRKCLNKINLYETFKNEDFVPRYWIVREKKDFIKIVKYSKMNYNRLFVKPAESNGSRGLYEILIDDRRLKFDEKPKPYNTVSINDFTNRLSDIEIFRAKGILVSEFLEGREWSVDCVATDRNIIVVSRVRDEIRSGICTKGHIESNPDLIELSKYIVRYLELQYCVNLQFIETVKGFKLLEINPRVSGTISLSCQVQNLPLLALDLAAGKRFEIMHFNYPNHTKLIRYYKELFY